MGCDCGQGLSDLSNRVDLLTRFLAEYGVPRERWHSTFQRSNVQTADSFGNATASIGRAPQGHAWKVERISISASAGSPTVGIFVGPRLNVDPSFRMDFDSAASDKTADEVNPIYVGPSDHLTIQWLGATAGAILSANFQITQYILGAPVLTPLG